MKLKVNRTTIELFEGAEIRHALISYLTRRRMSLKFLEQLEVRDVWGHEIIMFKKKYVLASMMLLAGLGVQAGEKKELHILSANDMHAAIECMPRVGFVADSLRALYPNLLVLSAGDNRSGEPLNDMYEIPAYPMVALMNIIGFNATTLGNHEFDSGQEGLAKLVSMSAFPTLCANVQPDAKWNMHVKPYQVFDCGGIKVGIVGAVALGAMGIPESHPKNTVDIKFTDPLETLQQYQFLRKECDVVLFLSHLGFESDVKVSKDLPWVDIIVGGHSHTQLKGGEMHNGLFITQNKNRLACVTHTTLTLEDGKVVDRQAENIAIRGGKNENTKPVGGFTVADALRLDPFQNEAIELQLTGKELIDMMKKCYDNDNQGFPYVGGMKVDYTVDPATKALTKVVLYGEDGKKLNLKKTYKVITNSYTVAISTTNRKDPGKGIGKITAQLVMDYLEHQGHVSYQGSRRIFRH